jgi:alkylation response protein AidB-like acyl-CoA dehydrogenase
MDFRDSPNDAEFREELRQWLSKEVPRMTSPPLELTQRCAWWRPWQRRLYEGGYAGLAWPAEFGGRGASVVQQAIFYEECDRAGAPDRLDAIGAGFAAPTLIEHGTVEQKNRFLKPILTGEELWCQLFSESGAGSDLASLKTRAIREGSRWRIQGQKVWTSGAQIADFAILLARTGNEERHRGISFFILPMRQPEVEVRPLKQMLGGTEFNEVFLDGAWVEENLLVGPIGGGWKVAMSTLGHERVTIATGRVNIVRLLDELVTLIRRSSTPNDEPLSHDASIRQRLADLYSRMALQRLTSKRILSGMTNQGGPGPEASTAKLFSAPLVEEICDFALSILGLEGLEDPADNDRQRAKWLRLAYQARGTSIAGGTTFIQRNIVAERVLGLPRG